MREQESPLGISNIFANDVTFKQILHGELMSVLKNDSLVKKVGGGRDRYWLKSRVTDLITWKLGLCIKWPKVEVHGARSHGCPVTLSDPDKKGGRCRGCLFVCSATAFTSSVWFQIQHKAVSVMMSSVFASALSIQVTYLGCGVLVAQLHCPGCPYSVVC